MINKFSYLVVIYFFLPMGAFAQAPTLAGWKSSSYLIDGKPVADFFAARRNDAQCRQQLETLQTEFFDAETEFKKLKKAFLDKKISKAELSRGNKLLNRAREAYYQKADLASQRFSQALKEVPDSKELQGLFESAVRSYFDFANDRLRGDGSTSACGNCSVPSVTLISFSEGLDRKYWYESHGFCSVAHLDPQIQSDGFAKASEFLRTPNRYPGLLRNVLTFVPFENGSPSNLGTAKEQDQFDAYMAVRAGKILGISISYGYFIKNKLTTPVVDGVSQFDMSFEAIESAGLTPPKVYEFPITADTSDPSQGTQVHPNALTEIIGWWHLDPKAGIVRYSTAAEFGVGLDSLKPTARRVHLDTIESIMNEFFVKGAN